MSSLKKKSAVALAWDFGGGIIGQASGFIISIFLARILEPEEFGMIGMSMVFINVLRIFMDLGFASALVQNKKNTSVTYSSIFYLNVGLGAVLTVLIYMSAPLVSAFYDNEVIGDLIRLLSVIFIISSFNIVQSTILRRSLNFKSLAIRDLTSQILAGLVAIVFAFYGFGVYALVIQQILAAIIKTILLWKITDWYPKLEFSWKEVKHLSGFSMYVLASQSLNQLIVQADTLIIGKLFSPATLGFFSRANSMNTLIYKNSVNSITKVFFPALSTVQDDDERFKGIYFKLIELVAGIAVFLTGILFLCGEELIIGLFGEKWEPSVFIFQILIIKGFTYPISSIIVSTFLAKGKSKENFHNGNIRKVVQLLPLIVAYLYGFNAFLYAMIASSILNWGLNNFFVARSFSIKFWDQVTTILPYVAVSILSIAVVIFIFPSERSYLWAIIKAGSFSVLFVTYLYLSKSILLNESIYYLNKVWQKLN